MTSHSVKVEHMVPFHDVDPLGVVWHGHYYKYMELARTELMRGLGLDGPDLLELGYKLYVIDSSCRYVSPLRYGDRFSVRARVLDFEYRILVGYELFNLTQDRRAAKGKTALATTDLQDRLLLRTPPAVLERLRA